MLVHSRWGRGLAWSVFGLLFLAVFGLPLLTVVTMAFAKTWNSTLPSGFTTQHVADALLHHGKVYLLTSLQTAILTTLISLFIGTVAAIGAHRASSAVRTFMDGALLVPIAVPSVVIGLNLLLAFSHEPIQLNGMPLMVILAHVCIVTAFSYSTASAALSRLDETTLQVAESLGAKPSYVLRRVTLPLLTPGLIAGAGLSFALSMGELGATIMVYPPAFATQPVAIFQITDKSADFITGGAYAVVLMTATVITLILMSLVKSKASYR